MSSTPWEINQLIKEMQIKTTMRHHLMPVRLAIKKVRKNAEDVDKVKVCALLAGL